MGRIGFSGLCLYPSSVFLSDLGIDFSRPLTDFSMLYAPCEIGCGDGSARMRVTAYRGPAQVGTETTTVPVPGTWPTGVVHIAVPRGFDRVVVHWDAASPFCGDWAPIFMADVVTVILDSSVVSVPGPRREGGSASGPIAAPNPFRSETTLRFTASRPGSARVEGFDVAGRRVRRFDLAVSVPGAQAIEWDGRDSRGRAIEPGVCVIRVKHAAGEGEGVALRLR